MSSPIDLYAMRFWLFAGAGIAVLNPIVAPRARRWAFAALNLGFVAAFLGTSERFAAVIAGLMAIRATLGMLRPGRAGGAAAVTTLATATAGLFLVHKRPDLLAGRMPDADSLEAILVTIGFSYIALRLYELARAIREGRHQPPDLASMVNYLLPFHMLAAGPIQAYDDFVDQPPIPPPLDVDASLDALGRITSGLFKKYVLARLVQELFLTDYRSTGWYVLVEAQLTFLWLYLDFSAYSDVAVGVGRLMGVATPENFDRPLLARNIIEFWERWHISLSMFIRRNVFIPLQLALMRRTGGSRPLTVAALAFTASFLLCGLWHQVGWRWLAWGGFHAAGLIACNLYRHRLNKRLGRKGVNRYMENPWIRFAAIFLTFEFNAAAVFLVTYPFEVPRWISGHGY